MINLKKNDKLIIIIAVAVVVIAAIGIAAYNPPEEEIVNGKGGMQTYDVMWKTHSKTETVEDELYAGKKAPFTTEITIDHDNILKVNVEISWTDDFTHFGILSRGEDTLTAEVSYSSDIWESVGNGSMEFIKTVHSIPMDTQIEAVNELEALEELKEGYYDDSLTFTIDVSVQTGEKWFRPLKYLRDKGNAFDLTITYEYFEPSLTEGEDKNTGGDGNNDPPSGDDAFSRLGNLVNTGSCVRW